MDVVVDFLGMGRSQAVSFNDAHTKEEPLQVSFDFNMDLAELEAARAA